MEITFNSRTYGSKIVIIDDDDFEKLKKLKNLKWCIVKKRGYFYFQKRLSGNKLIELHRFIMGDPVKKYVDHINHNTLDNRKINLRICNNSTNLRNGNIRINNSSGVNGVHFDKFRNKWTAGIKVNYHRYALGRFKTFEEAVNARKIAEVKFFNI